MVPFASAAALPLLLSWQHPGDSTLVRYGAFPALLALLVLLLRRARLPSLGPIERVLASRWTVVAIGFLTAAAFGYEWGSLRRLPMIHDEAAYLLQARLFAHGMWTDSAPIPEFFEQPHVLVSPRLASKYPPGHSLLLAPGIWFDRPGLVPIVLLGVTGALLYALGRRAIGPWVGLFAWLLWIGLVGSTTAFRPSYFSEITTGALWLAAWWALLRWRGERRARYLLLVAACVGWAAITRPLTALALAVPIGVVVLILAWRRRAWRQLLAACALGIAILAIVPLWSARTTGDWRVTPIMLYTDQYMPFDVIGFGLRDRKPLRAVPPEIACFADMYGGSHRYHLAGTIPGSARARAKELVKDVFADRRRGLIVFAALGVLASPVELGIALGTCALLVLAYTTYAHEPGWTLYYLETQPTLVLLAAAGVWLVVSTVGRWWGRAPAGDPAGRTRARDAGTHLAAWCFVALLVLGLRPTWAEVGRVRHGKSIGDLPHRLFRQAVDSLPSARNIVFVHYAPGEGCQQNLVQNEPPLATARTWIVNDRGADDVRLLRAAPARSPYVFDARSGTMSSLPLQAGSMPASGDDTVRAGRLEGRGTP